MFLKVFRNSDLRSHFLRLAKLPKDERISLCMGQSNGWRTFCSSAGKDVTPSSSEEENEVKVSPPAKSKGGGFAEAMAKFEGHESFTKMLRKSAFVQMGDPQGKIAEGKIIHIVNDDLYIDFGSKFNCVCPRPSKNGAAYTLGKKVRLLVHDLELSTRFLGAATDLTILEADCTLLGLARPKLDQESSSDEQISKPVV